MSYAKAREISIADIPVIDVAPLAGAKAEAHRGVALAMREAAEQSGFFYIRNHGIARELIARTDALAREFFAQPLERKLAVAPLAHHRGFVRLGEAKMHANARPDLKESYVWGIDIGADDRDYLAGNRMIGPNRWPDFLPEMRATLNEYLAAANACGRMLLGAFALGIGVEPDRFTRCFAKPVSRGTLVYYPPQPPQEGEKQFGVSPHTDYGVITLLHQDAVGGLQVSNRRGEWLTAHPIEDTLVINVGDLLARWTNDRFRSTPHRVVNQSGRERLSIAVFVDPDYDTPIEPVVAPGEQARYPATRCGDYILGRFDRSFAYRQGD